MMNTRFNLVIKRITCFTLSIMFLLSCNSEKGTSPQSLKGNQDSIVVSEACVIIAYPDKERMAKFKLLAKGKGDDITIDDWKTSLEASRKYFEEQKVKIIETEAPVVIFVKADGSKKRIDYNHSDMPWNVVLFNGQDDPRQADITNPDPQFQEVMKK